MLKYFHPLPADLQDLRSGPLGPHLDNFAALLSGRSYCRTSGWKKVRLVADLSQWLAKRRMTVARFDEQQMNAFLKARWKKKRRQSGDSSTLALLFRHLRETQVIPRPQPPAARSSLDLLEGEYEQFLLQERSFAPASVTQYRFVIRRFLSYRFPRGQIRLNQLRSCDVINFVLHDSSSRGRRSLQLATCALRSFLRFLFQRGRIAVDLTAVVPAVAGWRLSELPRYLEAAQVEKLLRCCDRRRRVGKRNYAILLLLARLGLRAEEVAGLSLDDIDWNAGELRICGKGAHLDRLPLLQDVGKALVDYLQKGRPRSPSRRLFIRCRAPYEGFASSPTAICKIVQRSLARAQLHSRHQGAHLLRHSLATRMLRSGVSLAQVGQVLRHHRAQATEIYAKVDLAALRALAQPWPGGLL